MSPLHPPRAPPDHLRLQSFQILSRLFLIPAFRPWLIHIQHHVPRKRPTPLELLWNYFSFGAPLGTLLALLGSPAPSHLVDRVEAFDFARVGEGREERERYFVSFVNRVEILEVQGRLTYGEVLRSEDFLSESASAFGKVLRTVYRLLVALEETYPGIFVVPFGSTERRQEFIQELLDTERAHIALLKHVFDATTTLSQGLNFTEPCLECFLINRTRLLQYHERLLTRTEESVEKAVGIRWTDVFGLNASPFPHWTRQSTENYVQDDSTRSGVFGAYRLLCINYLSLVEFLEKTEFEPEMITHVQTILKNASTLISRVSNYKEILQDILDTTLPTSSPGYNSLCEAIFRIDDIAQTMQEAALQLRTMHGTQSLLGRVYFWPTTSLSDPDKLGVVLLDDCLVLGDGVKRRDCSVVLFEGGLVCCSEGRDTNNGVGKTKKSESRQRYPIYSWEMGPALRKKTPLDIVHAIPASQLDSVACVDTSSIQITWVDNDDVLRHLTFIDMSYPQWDQWVTTLDPFVPAVYRPPVAIPDVTINVGETPLSEDEDENGHMQAHPRSWSAVARKGPCSDASSFIIQEQDQDQDSPNSPLISPTTQEHLHSPSPLSIHQLQTNAILSSDGPPTPPPSDGEGDSSLTSSPPSNLSNLVDLTGKVKREGRYPSAHGGFSDVWKGVWDDGGRTRNVAVKVLRSKINDPELEGQMIRRLHRELNIWKTLDHPNILGLLGVAHDFGHYSSMVCPWMENGSASKHMERCGDIMSTSDRLKLLCEVAEGLSYLHSRSIVHGDLTGSNILITDDGKACLCDFGLSTIVAEFHHGAASATSTIGGAVRWADALLYRVHTEDGGQLPTITTSSDIYSFGSVMLEIMSGRIPYHYIRVDAQVVIELHKGNKPRRPAQSFVSNEEWEFIMRCWCDDVERRPDAGEVCRTVRALYAANSRLL